MKQGLVGPRSKLHSNNKLLHYKWLYGSICVCGNNPLEIRIVQTSEGRRKFKMHTEMQKNIISRIVYKLEVI